MSLKESLRDLAYRTTWRLAPNLHLALAAQSRPKEPVDPRIRYPSYKSLDGHLDLERLKALDGPLREGVARYLRDHETLLFNTGQLMLNGKASRQPGSRVIELAVSSRPFRYNDLNDCQAWSPGPAAERFPALMDFIATLPFEGTARMVIMCDTEGRAVTAHRDHQDTEVLHEFVWFRTNFDKPFFVQSWQTKERKFIEGHSAWFDTVNQYHGADPALDSCISIRVDGRFTEEFRARIPKPAFNAASTPSFWACLEG